MTQDTDSRASEGASLCPNCVDDQKCRRKMVCDASGWPLRPISADAAQAQEPSEEQITAALSAAAFFDTPQSRKDMRRALIAAADPSRLPELLGLAPSATQATSEIACHPSTDGAPAEPTGEMRWAGAQEAQRQLRWKPYEMDWQRAAAAIYKAMLAAAPPPPAAIAGESEQGLWLTDLFSLIHAWHGTRDGTPSKAKAWIALWDHAHNIGPHWRARAYIAASAPKEPAEPVPAQPTEAVQRLAAEQFPLPPAKVQAYADTNGLPTDDVKTCESCPTCGAPVTVFQPKVGEPIYTHKPADGVALPDGGQKK
jgi:hypothetical protein